MKIIYLFLFVLTTPFSILAEPIQVGNTGIKFIPPEGFMTISQEIIDIKWPNRNAPAYVVGNRKATTTVAYDLKPHVIPQKHLPEVLNSFISLFTRMIPGIQWIKKEIIEKSGQHWIYLEMTSNAVDTDIYNLILITGFQDKMLMFNFNSTKDDFPKYEKALRRSIESITLP